MYDTMQAESMKGAFTCGIVEQGLRSSHSQPAHSIPRFRQLSCMLVSTSNSSIPEYQHGPLVVYLITGERELRL